ncbi:MAG TPA: Rieske 2Fe-2S domain-containing protein [Acetobacteraceae bacterium]|nr:Rieske 2Fe-2S domain-containing protein [Acetobacteraceae bacterium]
MPDAATPLTARHAWPAGLTRVPFWVYQDPEVLRQEQEAVFEGPVWNYLCLEVEIPNPGDWRATWVGEMPVVVARDTEGRISAFENRCAHRGALICFEDGGSGAKDFTCPYHAWRYDLRGTLQSVAFQRGVNGKGGMPDAFRIGEHGPRKLRVTVWQGLVFGTFNSDTPEFESFIGPQVAVRLRVATSRKLEIIGRYVEALPNNWKLYAENVRDTYHASLLHLFFATFKINRLSQGGGVEINETGSCHVSTTLAPESAVDNAYAGMRSVDDDFKLRDPALVDVVEEHGDRVRQQIMSVFPTFVMQRTQNIMAIRQFVPRGVGGCDLHWIYLGYADDTPEMRARRLRQLNLAGPAGFVSMEDGCIGGFVERGAATAPRAMSVVEMGGAGVEAQDTRATEVAIRGFWRMWRGLVGL